MIYRSAWKAREWGLFENELLQYETEVVALGGNDASHHPFNF